jgi:colicin import membrane protein
LIRLTKRTRIVGFAAAGLMSVGTVGGTATAAFAATTSPTDAGTVAPAAMTAAVKAQPSQAVSQATAAKAATTSKTATSAKTAKTSATAHAKTQAKPAAAKSPKQIATAMLGGFGWTKAQFSYLDQLWHQESNWNPSATNASSGAYGIAQALPASQMSSAGSDWQTNASTQIKWGLNYIKDRYGSPQAAWAHETAQGWY